MALAIPGVHSRCGFIPDFLLEHVAENAASNPARSGRETLTADAPLRTRRARRTGPGTLPGRERPVAPAASTSPGPTGFTVHTAGHTTDLPGASVRSRGEPASGDTAVDEAYRGIAATLDLYAAVYGRASYDGEGTDLVLTVHYGQDYDNAFWNGEQLVFGDGDGEVFDRFTKPIDVLGHEFTHAVTEHTAGLTYQGQPGALNESVSDVFASCMKQRVLGQRAAEADWLIGAGIFLPGVQGRALRSMAEPGTAYDDPAVGKDPQVARMADYVETDSDNGGVHINSGIANKAFYLAATALGGDVWERAGRIWYAALTGGAGPDTDFASFARATVDAAHGVGGDEAVRAVTTAWTGVGVEPAAGPGTPGGPVPPAGGAAGHTVRVHRSGGFAGLERSGEVALDADPAEDPRAEEARRLVAGVDVAALEREPGSGPQPDRFVYVFELHGHRFTVHEPDLTDHLSRLARLLLGEQPPPHR